MARNSTQAVAPPAAELERWLTGYERMLLLRGFEEAMQTQFMRGEVHGTVHLYIGQEAVSSGVSLALRPEDWVAATYRGHGAALARGVDPAGLAAELMGRVTGTCGGRAGSMNVIDLAHGLIGCFGIIGGSAAAATGAGLSAKRTGAVAVAFFGDGSTNHGYFHECLNFAKVHDLPVLFVCENNLYGEFTPMAQVTAGADITARASAYDIPSERVDGNDLRAVHAAAAAAVERIRTDGGPAFIEAMTYRQVGHSKSDPGAYRPEGELERWLERDPLKIAREQLAADGVSSEQIEAIDARVAAQMEEAIEQALAAPYPDPVAQPATEYAA
ncbi:MAG TPA: thiamine pyrophosphate-dependent dehydrogenase E1 component subunit alpha [Conexibacter sp.]|nr:thiamine pyrophosphate-dependent dehydrogenase E1 component subunit alpha [Conexibacter sp.]